ncbi:MAG: hypothetical protein EAZ57_08225 [Cytophagales bacterium]|nr:MAG: hypothetical protein EAZ67_09300 [Cytophagales bacterium]TAF60319.1 MAG: hypothetical protein EAZ57_08225 [Cytophagales bacterium]
MERCTDKDFGLSMEVPTSWADDSNDTYYVIFYARPEKNYRSNVGFQKLGTRLGDEAALRMFTEKYKEKLSREHYQYKAVDEQWFTQAEKPAYLHRFEWQDPEMDVAFCALHAFLYASPSNVYEMKCLTIKPLLNDHLPIFEHILKSIRFVKRA